PAARTANATRFTTRVNEEAEEEFLSRLEELLWGDPAVNVLVEAPVARTGVAAPEPRRRVERAALENVGSVRRVRLARIGAGHGIAPVRPGAEGEVPERRHPEVVAGERDRAVVELLVVAVAREVRLARLTRPRRAAVRRARRPDVERRMRSAGGVVSDRPRDGIGRVEPAVPPDDVEDSAVGRDVREDLVADRLVVDQGGRSRDAGRAVQSHEVGARLPRAPRA